MKIENILWSAVAVVIAVAVGACLFAFKGEGTVASTNYGATAYGAGITNLVGGFAVATGNGVSPGFVETPQFNWYTSSGDVDQQAVHTAITTGTTTTFCSLQNPFASATSSYEAWFYVSSSSANAGNVVFGSSANSSATTSATNQQGQLTIAAGALNYMTSGTTTSGTFGLIPPGQFLNFSGGASGAAVVQYGGVCAGIFTQNN